MGNPAGSLNTIPVETVLSTVLFGAIHSDASYGSNPNTVTDEIPQSLVHPESRPFSISSEIKKIAWERAEEGSLPSPDLFRGVRPENPLLLQGFLALLGIN